MITGALQTSLGFHFGFGAAAVGMAIGLTQYALTRKNLPEEAHHVANPLPRNRVGLVITIAVAAVVVIVLAVLTGLVTATNLKWIIVALVVAATIAYFVVILSSAKVHDVERSRVFSFIPLFIASAAFWSLFQQQFTVLAVYADVRLDRNFFGWEMPPTWVQSINPIFIIIFAGVFAAMWTKLGHRQPRTPTKFSIALMVMGSGLPELHPAFRPEVRAAAGHRLDPLPVHHRRVDALPGGTVTGHQAGAEGLPHADGGAVLPFGFPGDDAFGYFRRLLQRRRTTLRTSR